LLLLRGTTLQHTTYKGPLGSVTVDTDLNSLRVHDGATFGGFVLSKVGHAHASNEVSNWLGYTPAALDSNGKLLAEQLPDGVGTGGNANLSLSSGSQGASYSESTGVLDLSGLSSATFGLTALIDATSQPLTVIVGGTLKASVFSGNGAGLTHLPADGLTTGQVAAARLGSGTADGTTFLRGDGTWSTISADGNLAASDITNALGYTPASLVNGIIPTEQIVLSTSDVTEGSRLYFSQARARFSISLTAGASGALYDNTTGVLDLSALTYNLTALQIKNALTYTPAALDSNGLLLASQVPKIAITDTFVVGSEAGMLALTAETGDVAIRTDLNKSFILKGADPTVLAAWQELLSPTAAVTSVNGQTGPVVLTSGDVGESTNLYYTDARSRASLSITAGTTGVTYDNTTGVLDLTALASTSSIILATSDTPTVDVATSGLYGGTNSGAHGVQLLWVNGNPVAGSRVWAQESVANGNMQINLYNDAVTTASTYMTLGVAGNITMGLATGTVTILGGAAVNGSAGLSVTGPISGGAISGTSFSGAGGSLTGLNASNLASGTVPTARLGSGTASASTILYGDGTWKTAPAGASIVSVNGYTTGAIVLKTDDIGEGTNNLYFTQTRSRNALSLTAGSSGITYSPSTGVLDCSGIVVGLTTVNGVVGSGGSVTITTSVINEGTNKYYTDTRARAAISLTAGTTGATYNSTTGVLDLSQLQGTTGTVTNVSVASANGVSGSVANPGTTPVITIALGAIVPTSVNASGNVTGATVTSTGTLTASGNLNLSGTLSGGTISGTRVNPRASGVTSGTTFTPPSDSVEYFTMTSLASNLTVANPSGTPVNGQKLLLMFLDNGTSRTISWGTSYRAIGITLPTSTIAGKTTYVGCIWNSVNSSWDAIATVTQA